MRKDNTDSWTVWSLSVFNQWSLILFNMHDACQQSRIMIFIDSNVQILIMSYHGSSLDNVRHQKNAKQDSRLAVAGGFCMKPNSDPWMVSAVVVKQIQRGDGKSDRRLAVAYTASEHDLHAETSVCRWWKFTPQELSSTDFVCFFESSQAINKCDSGGRRRHLGEKMTVMSARHSRWWPWGGRLVTMHRESELSQ